MTSNQDSPYNSDYAAYQLNRNFLRRLVRRYYLSAIARQVRGRAIDFGCGIGELLNFLPEGSAGLEINPAAVAWCRQKGLDVSLYDPDHDGYMFSGIRENQYQTFIMNHVLEHIAGAANVLKSIMESCRRMGICRIILVLPGEKGFAFDSTHVTFVTLKYLIENGLDNYAGFVIYRYRYFPLNLEFPGRWFTYHEIRIIYDRQDFSKNINK